MEELTRYDWSKIIKPVYAKVENQLTRDDVIEEMKDIGRMLTIIEFHDVNKLVTEASYICMKMGRNCYEHQI